MERHERYCFHNPKRECRTCEFHGDMKGHRLEDVIDAIEHGGVETARPIAEGCPACICSGIVQARKRAKGDEERSRLWLDIEFDYKKENDAFYRAVRESRPEDFM